MSEELEQTIEGILNGLAVGFGVGGIFAVICLWFLWNKTSFGDDMKEIFKKGSDL